MNRTLYAQVCPICGVSHFSTNELKSCLRGHERYARAELKKL